MLTPSSILRSIFFAVFFFLSPASVSFGLHIDHRSVEYNERGSSSLILIPSRIVLDTISECETKDFIVTVINPDAAVVTISGYSFGGASSSEFNVRMPASFPVTIRANDSIRMMLQLTPQSPGRKTATFKLFTDFPPYVSEEISIEAEVTRAALVYSPIGLNFGPINIGASRNLRMYIINTGRKDVRVSQLSIIGTDAIHFQIMNDSTPVILSPGKSYEIIIRFTPKFAGTFRSFLQVNSKDCNGLVSVISMDGIGVVGTIAEIALPALVRGKPGSTIIIPIRLLNRLPDISPRSFSFSFRYNYTTLLPLDVHFNNVSGLGYSASWSFPAPGVMDVAVSGLTPILDSGIIANIVAKVYLGDAVEFPISLEPFKFKDNVPFSIIYDGVFALDSICQIPKQIFRRRSSAFLLPPYPNPFNPTTTVSYILTEKSYVELTVLNIFGQKIMSLVNALETVGLHEIQFDGNRFPTGVYFVFLRTPSSTVLQRINLLR